MSTTNEVPHDHPLRIRCNGCRAEVDRLESAAMDRYRDLYRSSPSLPPAVSGSNAAPAFGDNDSKLTSEYVAGADLRSLSPVPRRSSLSPKAVIETVVMLAASVLLLIAWYRARPRR